MLRKSLNILLIEDDSADRFLIEELLSEEHLSFVLYKAETLQEGLKIIKEEVLDIILLDLSLPDSKGLDTFKSVYKMVRIPVVILTGLDDRDTALSAMSLGAQDYLPKQKLESSLLSSSIRYAIERYTNLMELKDKEEKLRDFSRDLKQLVEQKTQELKEAQEQLLKQEKLAILGQLAGGVGHELRNPLGVISNAVYFLQNTLSGEITMTYLDIISSEVKRSEKIVSSLLDMSRVKALEKEEFGISMLIDDVVKREKKPDNIEIIKNIEDNLPYIFIDYRQISQVLHNIILNSYQAMPEGGRVLLEAYLRDNRIRISVKDTGCGIKKEYMDKIFEPLFTTKARGIGLGLAVCRNLMEINGGTVMAESQEGKGSIFTLIFPVKEK
ncbi:MAG: ATP-binding protein [Candidatus Eremiobacterota bacterium]